MTINPGASATLKRPFFALLAFTTLFILPATASAALLSALLVPGATLDVGTLQFGGFNYLNTGDMPAPTNVNVVPYTDLAGNVGLMIQGAFLDFAPGTGSDAFLGFTVTETDASKLLAGATLAGDPQVMGGSGIASVTETFLPTDTNLSLTIFDSVPGSYKPTDSGTFAVPNTQVLVQKDILAFSATVGGGVPMLSWITQTFPETRIPIPEPATLALMGLGLIGFVWLRRRFK
jgi:hypothetical protein